MIEIKDRLPLGNGKNNIIKPADIPSSITTVADLITFLNAGFYADVKANNVTAGDDVGVSEIGVPTNKTLFESIEEGASQWGLASEMDFQTGETVLTAGWTYIAFPRPFFEIPKVGVTTTEEIAALSHINIKSITVDGFYCAVRVAGTTSGFIASASAGTSTVALTALNTTQTFAAAKINYVAVVCDGLTNY